MAVKEETVKVKDSRNPVREVSELMRDNYINGVQVALSLWEENLNFLNAQGDRLFDFQQDYIKTVGEFYSKLPNELGPVGNRNSKLIKTGINLLAAFQKDNVGSIRSISDKFTKETLGLTKRNFEKSFSLFDELY